MPTEITAPEESTRTSVQPQSEKVSQVLEAILSDSAQEPEVFLDETTVPYGGE